MKYVCSACGTMLTVDRDIDDDRTVDAAIAKHRVTACPGKFNEAAEMPWLAQASKIASSEQAPG